MYVHVILVLYEPATVQVVYPETCVTINVCIVDHVILGLLYHAVIFIHGFMQVIE